MDQEEGLVEHKFLPWSSSCYNVFSNLILNFQTNENNFISTCHHSINLECSFLWSFVNLKRRENIFHQLYILLSGEYFSVWRRPGMCDTAWSGNWSLSHQPPPPLSYHSDGEPWKLFDRKLFQSMIREVRSCFTEQSWAVAPVWLTLPLLLILWMWWNKLLTTLTVLSIIICQTVSVRRISSTWWMSLSGVRCTVLP